MKLLLATLDYFPSRGGVARYYYELVKALPEQPEVVTLKPNHYIWPHWLPFISIIYKALKKNTSDYLWVGQILPVGTVAWILHILFGCKYIVSLHGLDLLLAMKSPRKKYLVKKILNKASLITANSNFTASKIKSYGLGDFNIVVITPGVSSLPLVLEQQKNELKKRINLDNQPLILAVGRLVRRKGFDRLIKVMPEIWKKISDARCLIVGDGAEFADLQKEISKLEHAKQVEIVSNLSDQELSTAYSLASIFVMPVIDDPVDVEGFGIVCLEAAAAGVPVVATDCGGLTEAVNDGVTGILVKSYDVKSLAEGIIKILTDQSLARRFSEAGKLWAAKFTWNKSANEFWQAILNLKA